MANPTKNVPKIIPTSTPCTYFAIQMMTGLAIVPSTLTYLSGLPRRNPPPKYDQNQDPVPSLPGLSVETCSPGAVCYSRLLTGNGSGRHVTGSVKDCKFPTFMFVSGLLPSLAYFFLVSLLLTQVTAAVSKDPVWNATGG
jgi:hypothetical protein